MGLFAACLVSATLGCAAADDASVPPPTPSPNPSEPVTPEPEEPNPEDPNDPPVPADDGEANVVMTINGNPYVLNHAWHNGCAPVASAHHLVISAATSPEHPTSAPRAITLWWGTYKPWDDDKPHVGLNQVTFDAKLSETMHTYGQGTVTLEAPIELGGSVENNGPLSGSIDLTSGSVKLLGTFKAVPRAGLISDAECSYTE